MRVAVEYGAGHVEFDVADDDLIASWHGPPAIGAGEIEKRMRHALESPLEYPPLRQQVVPGDRIVIPVEPGLPGFAVILEVILGVLRDAGIDVAESVTLLATEPLPAGMTGTSLSSGVQLRVHDPDDSTRMAYLASTAGGRRIYLDRLLTDADVVLPVGWLGYDAVVGYHGPWAEVFPGLSNRETLHAYHAAGVESESARDRTLLGESAEVSWLLGSQFQVGVEVTTGGVADVLAGESARVQAHAKRLIDGQWRLRTERLADIAVAGVGVAWRPTTWGDLADGLRNAASLARTGGSVVVLTDLSAPPGPALGYLAEQIDPREGPTLLRGREDDDDYLEAHLIAAATLRSSVYLYSRLDPELVENLGMIPLERADQFLRLLRPGKTCVSLSPAERMRVKVVEVED